MNVGRRYIEFYVEDKKDAKFLDLVTNVARALEDEMHMVSNGCAEGVRTDLEYVIEHRCQEMKEVFRELLAEFGHDISIEEINSIFEAKSSEWMPF